MKPFFVILALCFVSSQATFTPTNYESLVNDIIQETKKITVDTAYALSHDCKEISVDALHKVEENFQAIENRKTKNKACVIAKEPAVIQTLKVMHDELNVCGEVAAKKSAQIMIDVYKATQQIIFDGFGVAKAYRRCRKYKSSFLKNSCYARLSVKATLYLKNARKSIKTIKQATNERIPAVCADANACAHTAADKAVAELDLIASEIDFCIG